MNVKRIVTVTFGLSFIACAVGMSRGFGSGYGAERFGGGMGGFNFHNDATAARPQDFSRSGNWGWAGNHGQYHANNAWNNNYRNTYVNNRYVYHGTTINNPVYGGYHAWEWNGGVAWYPAPDYWGGGFWGAMAIGAASAAVYGSIVANNVTYSSYQARPSSPGAKLLESYHLMQTPCGPPNLVVIYGPNNSVICAEPNNMVRAGNYTVNSSNLTLTSET